MEKALANTSREVANTVIGKLSEASQAQYQSLMSRIDRLDRDVSTTISSSYLALNASIRSLGEEVKAGQSLIITEIHKSNTNLNKTSAALSSEIKSVKKTVGYATTATIVVLAALVIAEGALLLRKK
ncbi:MAG: hypothetical protein GSR80_000349 [Desulfurococcales archaeon]|nr:hypothetical protein [Desulfurococcales archaeon]